MENGCNGVCGESSACQGCPSNSGQPGEACAGFTEAILPHNIKNVYGVLSGKGGVGKSSVTALLASSLNKKGLKVGILDADVTGPSIPKIMGVSGRVAGDGEHILPKVTEDGIKIISINLMLDDEESPVVWRGPIVSNLIQQFWTEVNWGELDVLLIDMPPGTGDVPITIFQSIPVDGIIMVTMPQDLVGLIVKKAVNMVKLVDIPLLGLVENMSYYACPDCGKKIELFGTSKADETAASLGIPVLAKLPINPEFAALSDEGKAEKAKSEEMDEVADWLEANALNQ